MPSTLSDLRRALNFVIGSTAGQNGNSLPGAIAMSDSQRAPDPHPLLSGLPKGGALILRDTDADRLEDMAREFVPKAHTVGLRVLISGNPRVALKTNADGIHLSEGALRRRPVSAWARLRPDWLITAAAHSHTAILRAARAKVDAVLFSPVFPTKSHPGAPSLGVGRFRAGCIEAQIPVYGLGGITQTNLRYLRGSRCSGVAGIGLFLRP